METTPARPPAAVQRYLTAHADTLRLDPQTAPLIAEAFTLGRGWHAAAQLPITPHTARVLRRAGVSAVSLDVGDNRRPDFRTADLING